MAIDRKKVRQVFMQVAHLPADEQARALDEACGGDVAFRAEAEVLLRAEAQAGGFMANPTVDPADGLAPTADSSENSETLDATPRSGLTARMAALSEKPGDVIGRYKLLQQIGEGGFGAVYMAEQEQPVRRRVALKIIKLGMDTRQVIARFEAERQALAMMDHPNIAKVFDAGATDTGRPYFVMELVKGISITEYCDKQNMSFRNRLQLFVQICGAVQHAHQKGIIHRDIKPSNVLVTHVDDKPVPKVIDFGIAKATEARLTEQTMFTEFGQFLGTPAYMSPEQADPIGVDVDTRSDIYALGVLLYELLTGATPFDLKTLRQAGLDEIKRIIREEEPSRPSTRLSSLGVGLDAIARQRSADPHKLGTFLRGDLDWIIMKALEKDRTRRYETANAFAKDIERHLADEPVVAGPPSTSYRIRKFVKRHRASVIAGSLVATALVMGVVGTTWGMVWAMRERDHAGASAQEARAAEADAEARAEQVQRIAAFQSAQLSGVDVAQMGISLRDALLQEVQQADEARGTPDERIKAHRDELEVLLAGVDFTGLALGALRTNILAPALETIDAEFADQPEVHSYLLQTVAETARNLGALDLALPSQQAAVALCTAELGESAPKTIDSRVQLGILLRLLGRFAEAEQRYTEAIADSTAANGADAPCTIRASLNLAVLYTAQGSNAEAEPLLRKALMFYRATAGPDDAETLGALNSLAVAVAQQGRTAEAEPLYRECVERFQRTAGPRNPRTLIARNNLATFYRAQKEYAKAEEIYHQTYDDARQVLGDDHAQTLMLLDNLGGAIYAQGRAEEALEYAQRALDGRSQVLGPHHPATARSYYNVGTLHRKLGRLAEAEADFRRALGGFRLVYGEAHANTIAARTSLSGLLLEEQHYSEAERELLDEVESLADLPTPVARDRYREVLGALAKFYRLWAQADPDGGHAAEAARWQSMLDNSNLREEGNHQDIRN